MNIHTLQVGSYSVNCTLLENSGKVLIVDPGQEPERISAAIEERGWRPEAILLTHGHFDHVNGIPGLLERYPGLPVCVSEADALVMAHPFNACPPEYGPIEVEKLKGGKLEKWNVEKGERPNDAIAEMLKSWGIEVISTPGHTPGGVCYYIPAPSQPSQPSQTSQTSPHPLLLAGDTLFAGSVGRTDLPGGDMATLMRSLDRLRTLPEDTVVIPGHGTTTTIGMELKSNPFLQ